jgi:predicted transcriptional regulator
MKQILTKQGEVKAIARFLGCNRNTVTSALQGKYNTELAQRIRKVAIKRGGVEISNK